MKVKTQKLHSLSYQAVGVNFAPRKFLILGKEDKKQKGNEKEEEWKTLLLVDGAKWKFQQWRFFLVENEISVKTIRLRVKKTCEEPRVVIRNVRIFE